MKLVWKLLRKNINKPQLIGFFVANVIGLMILLLAVQLYQDLKPVIVGKDTIFKKDYLTISKEVNLLNSLSNRASTFSQDEEKDIENQSFVKNIGIYTASQYRVYAGFSSKNIGLGLNTEMFFESVPDEFIDITPSDWTFSPSDNTIPIILPQDYLDLYNFGFAQANGTPQVSDKLLGLVNMDITLSGKGQTKQMVGRIVGFSNRINTILVPQSFMTWANEMYGNNVVDSRPSRLIVEVANIGDPALSKYFEANHYVASGDNTKASKIAFFLQIVLSIVAIVGLIICVLSFIILLLSIYLLVEKNMDKLRNLRLIGYSKSKVILPYEMLAIGLNLISFLIAVIGLYFIRLFYLKALTGLFPSNTSSSIVFSLLAGLGIIILMSLFNMFMIRRKVK